MQGRLGNRGETRDALLTPTAGHAPLALELLWESELGTGHRDRGAERQFESFARAAGGSGAGCAVGRAARPPALSAWRCGRGTRRFGRRRQDHERTTRVSPALRLALTHITRHLPSTVPLLFGPRAAPAPAARGAPTNRRSRAAAAMTSRVPDPSKAREAQDEYTKGSKACVACRCRRRGSPLVGAPDATSARLNGLLRSLTFRVRSPPCFTHAALPRARSSGSPTTSPRSRTSRRRVRGWARSTARS